MMTKQLDVSPDLKFPLAVLQDSTAVIGRKRVGKSNTAAVITEEAFDHHAQVIVIDPKGDWWGLRSSADGKTAGYPVVVIGGREAMLPLNSFAGAALADWVVDTGHSVVIDVSELNNTETDRLVSTFLLRLRDRKKAKPGPIFLVIDEADELAPEDTRFGAAFLKTLGAVIWMVKRGGFLGIGTLVITQRPASLSKNVLTQTEVLIALQITGSQDVDAADAWFKRQMTKAERGDFLANIGKLEKGEAYILSGQILRGIFRTKFRRRHTFDSGATPEFGKAARRPRVVAKVDLEQLSAAMAKSVDEVKASDPEILKTKVRELTNELAALKKTSFQAQEMAKEVAAKKPAKPVAMLKDAQISRLEKLADRLNTISGSYSGASSSVVAIAGSIVSAISAAKTVAPTPVVAAVRAGALTSERSPSSPSAHLTERRPTAVPARTIESNGKISAGAQRVLNAAAYLRSIGVEDPTGRRIAGIAGTSPKLSTWRGYLSELRAAGYLVGFALTDTGAQVALIDHVPTSTAELHAFALSKISEGARKALAALLEQFPGDLDRADVADAAGVDPGISTFRGYVAELNRLGFIESRGRRMRAADFLFMEAAS